MNLKALIEYYIPVETVPEKKGIMFDALLKLLLREDLEPSVRIPIVDNIFGFVHHKDHLATVLPWLETGTIKNNNGKEIF